MTVEELQSRHSGYVVERPSQKEKVRICVSHGSKCDTCGKPFNGQKCVRHDKGNLYLFWECFECYVESKSE